MISSNIDPKIAAGTLESEKLEKFKQDMEGLKRRLQTGRGDKEQQLRKACQKFEAVFIGKLWDQMKKSVPKEGYLHSPQEDQYLGMFDRAFSEKMAESGGIGLADIIYKQLSKKLKEASRTTLAGSVSIEPQPREPMPISVHGTPMPLDRSKGKTLEDWGGTKVVSSGSAPSGLDDGQEETSDHRLSDVEVQARIDVLARKLEAQRIKDELLRGAAAEHAERQTGTYPVEKKEEQGTTVGRKLAKIG